AELGQVDAGLDGEADAGDDAALVARLQVVDVHAVAVDLVADRMAGAMEEVGAEAALLDEAAGHVVHLVAVDGASRGGRILHEADGGVAGALDGLPDLAHPRGNLRAAESHPG